MIAERQQHFFRNICIGLVDGLTIPFAIAAGLSSVSASASPIIVACLIAAFTGAITMGVGGFLESRKYAPSESSATAAFTIGFGYVAGGLIVAAPFFFDERPNEAFWHTAVHTLIVLFAAGYFESKLNGGKGWLNALRVCVTAAIVAAAAYIVAKSF